jgi:EAL and modified HD-GYP domain-containing signal transduction protein
MVTAMMRARMCEELAKATKGAQPARAFTLGLLSTLDAVMDRSLPEVLADLPLTEDIAEALLRRKGALGTQLEIVLALERGDWSRIPVHAPQLQPAYLSALSWVAAMEDELARAP